MLQGLSNDDNTTPVTSAYLDFSVNVGSSGDYQLRVHYSFGGTETNLRDAWIYVNGIKVLIDSDEILEFAYTGVTDGKWTTYAYTEYVTVPLNAGDNDIRLVAVNTPGYERTITYTRTGNGGDEGDTAIGTMKGLANFDALEISGLPPITEGSGSTVLYTLTTGIGGGSGSISVSPEQDFYLPNTAITLTATADGGYQFDSWTGDAPSTDSIYNFNINSNLNLAARFIPTGATQPSTLVGFGAFQDDTPTPYTLTGGLGATVTTVADLTELTAALAGSGPLIIKVSGTIDNSDNPSVSLTVPSNTTLFGDPDAQGHLINIELKLQGENYIIRNMIFSEVVAVPIWNSNKTTLEVAEGTGNDAISINGGRHVWIDHCELYSSLSATRLYDFTSANDGPPDDIINEYDAKDFYDGLIDVKNSASFITLSNNYFHDHWKAILIGSSDTSENGDSETRITLHHNYFENVLSRIPLLRYGKGHFFNNFVLGTLVPLYGGFARVDTVSNIRMGAEALIEGNYIQGAEDTFGHFFGGTTGFWNLANNTYVEVINPVPTSTGSYMVPYSYTPEDSDSLNTSVPTEVGVGILTAGDLP